MGHEVAGERGNAAPGRLLEQRDRVHHDVRMELLAFGQGGLQSHNSHGAPEITHHVEQGGGRAGVFPFDPGGSNRGERGEAEGLAKSTDHVRPQKLRRGGIAGHVDVHEVARGEQGEARRDHQPRIVSPYQPRDEGDQQELRQARPGEHKADLFGVVALDASQINRHDEQGPVERGAEQEVGQDAEAEVPPRKQAQVQQRLPGCQLSRREHRERNHGHDR